MFYNSNSVFALKNETLSDDELLLLEPKETSSLPLLATKQLIQFIFRPFLKGYTYLSILIRNRHKHSIWKTLDITIFVEIYRFIRPFSQCGIIALSNRNFLDAYYLYLFAKYYTISDAIVWINF